MGVEQEYRELKELMLVRQFSLRAWNFRPHRPSLPHSHIQGKNKIFLEYAAILVLRDHTETAV